MSNMNSLETPQETEIETPKEEHERKIVQIEELKNGTFTVESQRRLEGADDTPEFSITVHCENGRPINISMQRYTNQNREPGKFGSIVEESYSTWEQELSAGRAQPLTEFIHNIDDLSLAQIVPRLEGVLEDRGYTPQIGSVSEFS